MVITAGPVLRPRDFLGHPASDPLTCFPQGKVIFTASGRGAILACLRALAVPSGSIALLPSYLCPAILEPFHAHGCRIRFYEVSEHLEPKMDQFSQLLEQTAAKVVFIIHYFGFPMANFEDFISSCHNRGVLVIEDCAHALLSRYHGRLLGEWGDGAVFSLRKVLPLPEGGFAIIHGATAGIDQKPCLKVTEFWKLSRELIYWVDASVGLSLRSRLLGFCGLRDWIEARDVNSLQSMEEPLGRMSHWLLKKMPLHEIVRQRRENYGYLADYLKTKKGLVLLQPNLPDGVCPVGLPVLAAGRDKLRNILYRKGIAVRAYWDTLPEEVAQFREAQEISRQILVLPVHEDLSKDQLGRVAEELVSVPL